MELLLGPLQLLGCRVPVMLLQVILHGFFHDLQRKTGSTFAAFQSAAMVGALPVAVPVAAGVAGAAATYTVYTYKDDPAKFVR